MHSTLSWAPPDSARLPPAHHSLLLLSLRLRQGQGQLQLLLFLQGCLVPFWGQLRMTGQGQRGQGSRRPQRPGQYLRLLRQRAGQVLRGQLRCRGRFSLRFSGEDRMPCVTGCCILPPCVLGHSLGLPSDTPREGRRGFHRPHPEKSWTLKPVVTSGLQGPGQVTGLNDSPLPGNGAQTPPHCSFPQKRTSQWSGLQISLPQIIRSHH